MSDTSEAEGGAPLVRILCAPPSTTSSHQLTLFWKRHADDDALGRSR